MLSTELVHDSFTVSNRLAGKMVEISQCYVCAAMNGDRRQMKKKNYRDCIQRIPSLCAGYKPHDIFNADKMTLLQSSVF